MAAAGTQRSVASATGRCAASTEVAGVAARIAIATTRLTRRRPSVAPCSAARAGRRDNRALERRADVLVYSSAPLARDVEIMGPVTADLHVRSTLDHTDFFVRLCDVEPSGKSWNICDGLSHLTPERVAAAAGRQRARCGEPLAGSARIQAGASHSRSGLERRASSIRAQSRRGRAVRDGGGHARCGPGGLA